MNSLIASREVLGTVLLLREVLVDAMDEARRGRWPPTSEEDELGARDRECLWLLVVLEESIAGREAARRAKLGAPLCRRTATTVFLSEAEVSD
jgi:hypothetical protein